MKNKILIIATLAGSLALSSCEDFLTHDNTTSANRPSSTLTRLWKQLPHRFITMCGTVLMIKPTIAWETDVQTTSPPVGQTISILILTLRKQH